MTVFKTYVTSILSLPEAENVKFVLSGNKLSGTTGALFAKQYSANKDFNLTLSEKDASVFAKSISFLMNRPKNANKLSVHLDKK